MEGLFYSIMTTPYNGRDLDTDPPDTQGSSSDYLQYLARGTYSTVQNLVSYLKELARVPLLLLRKFDSLLTRAEQMSFFLL